MINVTLFIRINPKAVTLLIYEDPATLVRFIYDCLLDNPKFGQAFVKKFPYHYLALKAKGH